MNIPFWIIWLIISAILLVGEIITVGFMLLWFAIGAFLAMLVSLITDNLFIQTLVFVVTSTLLLIFTKPLLSRYTKKDTTVTGSATIIGKIGIVTEEISQINATGQIKVGGDLWSATTNNPNLIIPKGAEVQVISINGVKACVSENYRMPQKIE